MLTVRGKFIKGEIRLVDDVPVDGEVDVLVTFLDAESSIIVFSTDRDEDFLKQALQRKFDLTQREIEVLGLMQQGLTNKEIAADLDLSDGTTRNFTSSIYRKLKVRNRTGAVQKAIEVGLITASS